MATSRARPLHDSQSRVSCPRILNASCCTGSSSAGSGEVLRAVSPKNAMRTASMCMPKTLAGSMGAG